MTKKPATAVRFDVCGIIGLVFFSWHANICGTEIPKLTATKPVPKLEARKPDVLSPGWHAEITQLHCFPDLSSCLSYAGEPHQLVQCKFRCLQKKT